MRKSILLTILFLITFVVFPFTVRANSTGFIIGDLVTIRSSKNGSSVCKVLYGTNLTILEDDGTWMKVIYDGQNVGYVSSQYVAEYSKITKNDPEYCNYLKGIGFPESYCPYLSYLHSIHPNWRFIASNTGLDFYTAVNEESDMNEIQLTANSTELLNKYINAYAKNNHVVEGTNWYYTNPKVTAYFMDPRNFLIEKAMFQFQTLSFDETTDTADAVRSIFGSSYLSQGDYVNWFIDGGRQYGVSALHLASKSVLEVGTNPNATMVSGTATNNGLTTYTTKKGNTYNIYGFYNYYSIGAYSSESNPALSALAFAGGYNGSNTSHLRPWTSRELAIKGGASFISNGYINKGQDTLYYEKFNTSPKSVYSKYTNQYMGNILAPYDEGLDMKKALANNGMLDKAFSFTIPVYNNMPIQTVQASLISNNSLLAAIYVDGKIIDGFDEDITNYNYYVLQNVNHVNVSAALSSPDSSLSGGGEVEIKEDTTTVNLTVTSAAGTQKTYAIIIHRVADDKTPKDIVSKMNVRINNSNIYDLSVGTLVSTLVSSANGVSPYAKVSVTDSAGRVVDNNANVKTGYNLVISTVSGGQASYQLSIHGDVNSDGNVNIQDLLRIQKHILGSINLGGSEYYACDVNADGTVNIQDLLRVQKYLLGSLSL